MNCYECLYIIQPELGDEAEGAARDRVADIIANTGGFIYLRENWGRKRLAYEIRKQNKGVYQLLKFVGTPETLTQMERLFRLDEAYLKYLTLVLREDPATVSELPPESSEDKTTEAAPEESVEAKDDTTTDAKAEPKAEATPEPAAVAAEE